MSDPLTYDSDRLIRDWRERYAGRRTVPWKMLNDAEVLVRDAIARELEQRDRDLKADRERELEQRERQLAWTEARHEQQLDRLRRQVAEAEAKILKLTPRVTLMREERETIEDGAVVRLLAPTVPGYGADKSLPRPWMLGELEDVIHRLRIGGAMDDTEVRFKRDAIEACVPFAEFALAPEPRPAGQPHGKALKLRAQHRFARIAAGAAALIALFAVVARCAT